MHFAKVYILYISVCVLWACTDIESLPTGSPRREVLVLFSPNGLGDNGYNDQVLRGVVRYANGDKGADVEVDYYNPMSLEDGVRIIDEWHDATFDEGSGLLVLASAIYKDTLTNRLQKRPLDASHRQVLMFETDEVALPGVSTFSLSMYGTAYIAGAVAKEMHSTPLIALANPTDKSINVAADGFREGYAAYR